MTDIISVFLVVMGVALGSFGTALIPRLHFDQKGLFTGRSKCPICGKPLKWYQLIPVMSWLVQRARAACCKNRISSVYPMIELSFLVIFFVLVHKFYPNTEIYPMLVAATFALWMGWYDGLFLEVDRRLSWPAIAFAILWIPFREDPWQVFVLGGVLGWGFYAVQYYASRGRWVGFGDLELGLWMGLILGWKYALMGLFLAYIFGSCIVLIGLLTRKLKRGDTLPMGTFLMFAVIVMLHSGPEIWDWYWGILGGTSSP